MNKSELIEQLKKIPGNPVVLVRFGLDWWDAVGVGYGATGEHRNGISVYAFDKSKINYLGPVP